MECNRCLATVTPMYFVEKNGKGWEERQEKATGSPEAKRRKLNDSYAAAAMDPQYSPRSKACDEDACDPTNGTTEHSRPDQAWICWRKCAMIVCRVCKDKYDDELSERRD